MRSAFSASFNGAMQQTLAGYAANGSIVHYLDLGLVLDNIVANPTAYGITRGLACPALPSTSCLFNSAGYVFYLDGLHLTSDGFEIVAAYIATQLAGPLTLQAPADIGVDTAHQFGRTLQSRLGSTGFAEPAAGPALLRRRRRLVVQAPRIARQRHVRQFGLRDYRRRRIWLWRGLGRPCGQLQPAQSQLPQRRGRSETDSVQVGAFAGFGFGAGGFVKVHAGYGWDDHDIDRRGVVEGMDASPKGHHWLAGARAGYLMPMAGLSLGPVAALDYARRG